LSHMIVSLTMASPAQLKLVAIDNHQSIIIILVSYI